MKRKRKQKRDRKKLLFKAAKKGNKAAIQKLLRVYKLKVWTEQELSVLNWYLKNKESVQQTINEEPRHFPFSIDGLKVLWFALLKIPYCCICILDKDKNSHYWIAYSTKKGWQLAFDLKYWESYEIPERPRKKRKEIQQ